MKRYLDHATCNSKPGAKTRKLRDGAGLWLHVEPSGARGWRFYYRRPVSKKQNTISFGAFPAVSLADARAQCDAARALLAKGIDPSEHKQEVRRAAAVSADAVLFQKVADDWFAEVIVSSNDPQTQRRVKIEMNELTRAFGKRAIHSIEPYRVGRHAQGDLCQRASEQDPARARAGLAHLVLRDLRRLVQIRHRRAVQGTVCAQVHQAPGDHRSTRNHRATENRGAGRQADARHPRLSRRDSHHRGAGNDGADVAAPAQHPRNALVGNRSAAYG